MVGGPAEVMYKMEIVPGTVSTGHGDDRLTASAKACEQKKAILATPFSPEKRCIYKYLTSSYTAC